jgi:hypothetical protein
MVRFMVPVVDSGCTVARNYLSGLRELGAKLRRPDSEYIVV